jgi:hypothetical protein
VRKIIIALNVAFTLAAGHLPAAWAATFTINTFDNGWYRDDGTHSPSTENIFVGFDISGNSGVYNNWFAFDLTPLAGKTFASATLVIFGDNGRYASPFSSESYNFFDYGGSIDSLLDGTGGMVAHNDLGSGADYGGATVFGQSNQPMPEVSVALLLAAINDINAAAASADRRFVIGGSVFGAAEGFAGGLYAFSGDFPAAQLVLSEVPLPTALPLFITGFAGLSWIARRRKKQAA